MSQFGDRREHLSHFLLRNEILARFGISADVLGAPEEDRIARIANCIAKADPSSRNVRAAIDAWHRGGDSGQGVRQAASDLFNEISKLTTVRPTNRFPRETVVYDWIEKMELCLTSLDRSREYSSEERQRLAEHFAEATVLLLEFLRGLDPDSVEFLNYFERVQ